MIHKLVWSEYKESKVFEEKYGNYNQAPAGFKEINESEFADSDFFTYNFTHMENRQIHNLPDEPYVLGISLYYMHQGHGYGMSRKPEKVDYKEGQRIVVEPAMVRYFRFGCDHQFREYGPEEAKEKELGYSYGNCIHNYICDKCGYTEWVDSSD